MTSRRLLVAGNWKMNPTTWEEAVELARGVAAAAAGHRAPRLDVAVFPPTAWLHRVSVVLEGTFVEVGAQDTYWEPSGPYTGATSIAMVAEICGWTLVGHSERRLYFAMTDDDVARSAAAAVAAGVRALICVGENLDEYHAGRTAEVVRRQVRGALSRLGDRAAEIAFAYEPVWAIGTGHTPVPEEVGEVLELIRSEAAPILGGDAGTSLRVLYGGSVKPDNIASFTTLPVCDGVLAGGASLQADEFDALVRIVAEEVTG